MEVVQNDCITYKVKGTTIDFTSEVMDYGINVVAIINDQYHYLGLVTINIAAAIHVWQQIHNHKMNEKEIIEVLKENDLLTKN